MLGVHKSVTMCCIARMYIYIVVGACMTLMWDLMVVFVHYILDTHDISNNMYISVSVSSHLPLSNSAQIS